ncbi:hypothetical protein RUND412_006573 [Rhizina undulata]
MPLSTLNDADEALRINPNLDPRPYIRRDIQAVISTFPAEWRTLPVSGEIHANPEVGLERLQAAVFYTGFAVVVSGGSAHLKQFERSKSRTPRVEYACIHHSQSNNCKRPKGQMPRTLNAVSEKVFQEIKANNQHITIDGQLVRQRQTVMTKLVWYDCMPPAVFISDQTRGLKPCLEEKRPHLFHSLCMWHAFSNIRKKVLTVRETPTEEELTWVNRHVLE